MLANVAEALFSNEAFVTALGTLLAGLLTWGFALFRSWINTKIKDDKLKAAVDAATSVLEAVTLATQHAVVEALKNDGAFTKDEQQKVLADAVAQTKALMSEATKKYIEENFGDLDVWISTKIEAFIAKQIKHIG